MARIWKEVTYNLQVCEFLAPMTENCLERIEKKLNYDFFYDEIYDKIANSSSLFHFCAEVGNPDDV